MFGKAGLSKRPYGHGCDPKTECFSLEHEGPTESPDSTVPFFGHCPFSRWTARALCIPRILPIFVRDVGSCSYSRAKIDITAGQDSGHF